MKKIMKFCLWLVSLTPFVVYKYSYFPYSAGEALFFRGIISLIGLLFLIHFFSNSDFKKLVIEKIIILVNKKLFLWVLFFLGSVLLSTIFAVNKFNALWGTLERGEGFVGYFFALLFIVFSYIIFEKKDWILFFKFNLFSSIILVSKEIVQFSGGNTRPSSFFDNPTFLAGFLIFPLFSALIVFNFEKGRIWRSFSIVSFGVSILGIFLTQTRSTILGVFVGVVSVLLFFVFSKKDIFLFDKLKVRTVASYSLVVLVLFSLFFVFTREYSFWKNIPGISRVAEIGSGDSTTDTRLLATKMGLNASNPIKNGVKKFLIGWGEDNFNNAYGLYFNPRQFDYEMRWFDRSHNKFIDVLVMNGIIGLLCYLGIYFFLFRSIILSTNISSILKTAILFFTTSYFVHLIFVFDQIPTMIAFFAVISFSLACNTHYSNQKINTLKNKNILINIFSVGVICIALFFYIRNDVISAIQMKRYRAIKENIELGIPVKNIDAVFMPLTFGQDNILKDFLSFTEKGLKENNQPIALYSDIALQKAKKYTEGVPFDVKFLVNIASAYSNQGQIKKNPLLINEGEFYHRKMVVYAPNRPDSNYGLALNLFYQKRYEESILFFEKAFNLSQVYFLSNQKLNEIFYSNFFKYFYDKRDVSNFIITVNRLENMKYLTVQNATQLKSSILDDHFWPPVNFN